MDLLNLLADLKKELGQNAAEVEKSLEEAKELQNKRLANSTENTSNAGWGKELVPTNTLLSTVMTIAGNEASFIRALPGFHGYNMGISEKLPIRGALPRARANTEWLSGAGLIAEGKQRVATGEVTITQKPLIVQVDISKRFANYSIDDLMSYVTQEIARSVEADTEFVILNADATATATGNINSVDQAAATTFGADDIRLAYADSLRYHMLSNSLYEDVGTLEWGHFIAVRQKLGRYATKLSDLLLLMDSVAYHKALTLDEFKKANENGRASTITTGAISNIAGVDMYLPDSYPATTSTGAMSKTAANNVKGGFMYLYKPAVQYGFGQDLEIDVVKIPGKGFSIIGTYEFGFAIVDKKAGETDNWIYGGINVSELTVPAGSGSGSGSGS